MAAAVMRKAIGSGFLSYVEMRVIIGFSPKVPILGKNEETCSPCAGGSGSDVARGCGFCTSSPVFNAGFNCPQPEKLRLQAIWVD